ncbi:hypothetical protein PHYPSEUDO_001807 [Phytophthora pseudosyringae]|uniref:Uncharacterized protein n=1 Tax=Phytophthora pseudosyringae TaxID=221518 RepID=A0A8T1VYZ0_9STRA|nr:hypothetical protein PHYPSEUDO_001807 [Phytophthora pseudosyringae]
MLKGFALLGPLGAAAPRREKQMRDRCSFAAGMSPTPVISVGGTPLALFSAPFDWKAAPRNWTRRLILEATSFARRDV